MEERNHRLTHLGWPDYAFSGLASGLAAFSAGYGLGVPQVAYIFVACITIGTLFSAGIQKVLPKQMAGADGFLYALFGILTMVYAKDLNSLLPGEGFVDQLRPAGWLCWMLVFGSFCMWRDSTILFQAVPGIALFGLVGTWDTFRGAPFLFFGFLLCFATLFARAHARAMMVSAKESGYTSNALDQNEPGGFLRALRTGPWRWVAGPEWALGSALVVVMLSLIGAPAFQFALKDVSGRIHFSPPTARMQQNYFGSTAASSTNFRESSQVEVGTGPHRPLDGVPIFSLRFPTPVYLKFHTFQAYTSNHAWAQINEVATQNEQLFQKDVAGATRSKTVPFELSYIQGSFDSIPIPGDLEGLDEVSHSQFRVDGTVANIQQREFAGLATVHGSVRVPETTPSGTASNDPDLSDFQDLSLVPISPRLSQLTTSAIAHASTDAEKAEAIRSTIAARCTYDLQAEAVPSGHEPVDYFLFEGKRGYCDLFASSMVVMARIAHMPARFVSGYAPFTNPDRDKNGFFTYFDTDYHAWAEIYFKNVGWVIFDATDGAAQAPDAGRGASKESRPWYLQASVIFGSASILTVALAAGFYRLFQNRIRWGFRSKKRAELERLYIDLEHNLESRTGKPRRPSQTPYEYLETVKSYLDGTFEAVQLATIGFVETFYGSAEPSMDDISNVRQRIFAAKEALKSVKKTRGAIDGQSEADGA